MLRMEDDAFPTVGIIHSQQVDASLSLSSVVMGIILFGLDFWARARRSFT